MKLLWHDAYKKLSGDPIFDEEFQKFILKIIEQSQDNKVITIKVDEEIQKFMNMYVSKLRKDKIERILGKKDI